MSGQMARKVRKDVNWKLILIIAASLLAIGCICAGLLACTPDENKGKAVIDDNVYVNSIYVGGLNAEEAKQKIEQTVNGEYFNKTVNVKYLGEAYGINLKEAVTLNAEETVKAALSVSDKGKKTVVPFSVNVNQSQLSAELLSYFSKRENKNNMFSFNKDYTEVQVDASKITELLDVDKTLNVIFENVKKDIYTDVDGIVIKTGDDGFGEALYLRLARRAENATVGMNEDKSTYIIAEVVGISADKSEFLKLYSENGGKFKMTVQPTFPEVTTEDLDIEFYQDVLGTYTSKYNGNLRNRTKNVSLAADFVNGTVIMPGQRFSYNSVVGKRTADRGFVKATVYTGEGTEEGLGGGICQVSSTIYCAQLRANLKTVSRTNHSYTVVYVPLGQDATVVYGAIDYVFENDTNYPIMIQTVMGGGKLTVNILGTKKDKSLTYDVVSVTNSTTPKQEVRKETSDLPQGTTEVKQNGQNGAVVSTYKIYYKDGVEQSREYIGKSTYVPMNKIVLVGTAPVGIPDENPEIKEDTEDGDEAGTDVDIEIPDDITDIPVDIQRPSDIEPDVPVTGDDEEPELGELPTSDTGL